MRHPGWLAVSLFALACAGAEAQRVGPPCATESATLRAPAAEPEASLAGLGGGWVGGFALASIGLGEPGIWVNFTQRRFAAFSEVPTDTALLHGTRHGDEIHFEAVLGGALLAFSGRLLAADTLRGEVELDGARGPFELTRYAHDGAGEFFAKTGGTYATADGKTLAVTTSGILRTLFDVESGEVRSLFQREDGGFSVGLGLSAIYPSHGRLTFARDATGRAERLDWKRDDGTLVVASRVTVHAEELRFASEGATLAGTLYTPPGPGPHPLVVNVHGSGPITRHEGWIQQMMAVFLREGIAVFAYDKRGAGQSEGEYVGPGGRTTNNVSPENLALLAKDVRAAVAAAAVRPGIDRRRVGLFGLSQAGWIMPLAAAGTPAIHFMISLSGPTVPTSLEALHSILLNDGKTSSNLSLEDVDALVQRAPREGFDPAPFIAKLRIPALFVFGALDSSIPVPESVRALEKLRRGHDFEVVTLKDAGHDLFRLPRDTVAEHYRSPGFAPDELSTLRRWLSARVRQARSPAAASAPN